MSLPPVDPSVTAGAVAALPARLKGRLDATVEQARTWPVASDGSTVVVRPDEKTTVTLTIPVATVADAVCSCLLSPRCLHRAAVLSAAPIAPLDPTGAPQTLDPATDEPAEVDRGGASNGPPERPASAADRPSEERLATAERAGADHRLTAGETALSDQLPATGGRVLSDQLPATGGTALSDQQSGTGGRAVSHELPATGGRARSDRRPVPDGRSEVREGAPQVSVSQRDAADVLRVAAAEMLAGGVPGGGAVMQASLLRAAHQARVAGLPAAAAAAVRVVEHLRAARREDPAFRRAELAAGMRELLLNCHRLVAGDGTAIGVARRDYQSVGDLRLHGLFCEPVRAATGHAGAVTYLADPRGRVWVVSDVKPAEPSAALTATRASVDLGEVRLSHHNLSRAGLRAINAHASGAGRLSHGRARQAVAAPGASWFEEPLDVLWHVGLAEQVDRWLAAAALPAHERHAAHDLAYLEGVIVGADRRGLLLAIKGSDGVTGSDGSTGSDGVTGGDSSTGSDGVTGIAARGGAAPSVARPVIVGVPHEDPALPYVGNLRLLAAHAGGRPVRLIGRFTGPRRIDALALAAPWLPPAYGGHVDLGAQRLNRADVPGTVPVDPSVGNDGDGSTAPPLHLVRHQLERMVATGRAALLSGAEEDARRLSAAHLATAAAVVRALGDAGVRRTRDVFGRLDPHDSELLAGAWLAAAVYERAATEEATRIAWG